MRGRWPLPPLICRRSALHPGYFLPDEKVTKESPRAAPFGIPRCVVAALAALAYASRRATFSHRKRPICHFELVGKSVLFFPLVPSREHPLLSIRGAAGLASRMLEGFIYRTQYREGRRPWEQRGQGPLRRKSRNQGVPGISLPTFSTRESRPGSEGLRPHKKPGSTTHPSVEKPPKN